MNEQELIEKLKYMYDNAADKKQVASIHLFGIKYREQLKNKNLKNIALKATSKESYYSEINKGMSLGQLLNENNLLKNKNNSINKNSNDIGIKNIILYGAPGVGKTHNYQNLISMIEDGKSQKEIFDTISKNEKIEQNSEIFQTIKDEKRVEFVTFHQSYSYEDFIEGFRPNDDGDIERKDGIFKIISDSARKNPQNKNISFDEAYLILKQLYMKNKLVDLKTTMGKEIIINSFEDNSINAQTVDTQRAQYISKSNLKIISEAILKNLLDKQSDIESLDVTRDAISLAGYYYAISKKIVEITKEYAKQQNFYIVIDEINRGNISKIFGELITLIEEDKRDNYEVTLPYSKESFKVPSNLYIIATMNSTDKSIATIDIALRRRFTFLNMKPNSNLVKDNEAKELMEKLNIFIKDSLSEDYMLGHSYFMNVENQEDLEFVKEYKIKPLLEEYFYTDDRRDEVLKILNKDDS